MAVVGIYRLAGEDFVAGTQDLYFHGTLPCHWMTTTAQHLLRCPRLGYESPQAFIALTHRRNASRLWAGSRWSTFLRMLQTASFVASNPVRSSIGFNQINRRQRRFSFLNSAVR